MSNKYKKPKTYKDLLIWKKAFKTSILIFELSKTLPKDIATRIILSQILRASFSVGSNIAEGYGRYNSKEYKRFLVIALGSANEVDYWLTLLQTIYSNRHEKINLIIKSNMETIKLLSITIKKLKA